MERRSHDLGRAELAQGLIQRALASTFGALDGEGRLHALAHVAEQETRAGALVEPAALEVAATRFEAVGRMLRIQAQANASGDSATGPAEPAPKRRRPGMPGYVPSDALVHWGKGAARRDR